MSLEDVELALTKAVGDVQNTWPIAYPNRELPTNDLPYIRMHFFFAAGGAATMGDTGSNEYTGFIQIDVCDAINTGVGNSAAMLELYRQAFDIGKSFVFNGQTVVITSVKGGPRATDDTKVVSVITFYWRSFISRG